MSYHLNEIPRGVFGEISKIDEELCELVDAVQQGNKIMTLCELSDIVGAIEGFLEKQHPTITLADLIIMKDATKRAFVSGARKTKGDKQ